MPLVSHWQSEREKTSRKGRCGSLGRPWYSTTKFPGPCIMLYGTVDIFSWTYFWITSSKPVAKKCFPWLDKTWNRIVWTGEVTGQTATTVIMHNHIVDTPSAAIWPFVTTMNQVLTKHQLPTIKPKIAAFLADSQSGFEIMQLQARARSSSWKYSWCLNCNLNLEF